MSIYRKNALSQLQDTIEILMLDTNQSLSIEEIFQSAKKYEINIWKSQIEEYKLNSLRDSSVDYKSTIKMCKNMIKELSKITIEEILN